MCGRVVYCVVGFCIVCYGSVLCARVVSTVW